MILMSSSQILVKWPRNILYLVCLNQLDKLQVSNKLILLHLFYLKCLKPYQYVQIICIRQEYLKPYQYEKIICIRQEYLKPYQCVQIICIRQEYLKPYQCV